VRLTRTRTSVTARWTKVTGAAGYLVTLREHSGKQTLLQVRPSRTKAAFKVPADQSGAVTVRAVGPLRDRGKPRTAEFKARAKAKSRLRPFSELRKG
jgi:hypothetical protein